MTIEKADRLKRLPPYLFKEIDRLKAEIQAQGVDVISLGVGDPDLPTPKHIIAHLQQAAEDPSTHQYPSYSGMNDLKGSVARWYQRRFGVTLDPETEVITLIGSKEGIASRWFGHHVGQFHNNMYPNSLYKNIRLRHCIYFVRNYNSHE